MPLGMSPRSARSIGFLRRLPPPPPPPWPFPLCVLLPGEILLTNALTGTSIPKIGLITRLLLSVGVVEPPGSIQRWTNHDCLPETRSIFVREVFDVDIDLLKVKNALLGQMLAIRSALGISGWNQEN
jgi:hypothetical protein